MQSEASITIPKKQIQASVALFTTVPIRTKGLYCSNANHYLDIRHTAPTTSPNSCVRGGSMLTTECSSTQGTLALTVCHLYLQERGPSLDSRSATGIRKLTQSFAGSHTQYTFVGPLWDAVMPASNSRRSVRACLSSFRSPQLIAPGGNRLACYTMLGQVMK